MPDRGTLLSSQISAFLDNDPWNTTIVNNGSYIDIVQNVFYTRGQPALWFYAAAVSHCIASHRGLKLTQSNVGHIQGSTLVFLAMMSFIIRWPRGAL